jgi:hypothetical protein
MGCNAILGNDEGVLATNAGADAAADTTQSDGQAGPRADSSPDVATDAPSCPDAGAPVDAAPALCAAGIVYVSPSGDDARDGCTPCTAKQSIGGALASIVAATTPGDAGATDGGTMDAGHPGDAGHASDAGDAGSSALAMAIHVCAGTFAEAALTLAVPVSLMGGYSCGTWSRTASYGYPTFDGVDETIVTPASSQLDVDTLRITGAAVDSTVLVDGLTFKGTTTSTAGRAAIHVQSNAAPVLSNDQILGGSANTPSPGAGASNGMIVSGASPEITLDLIDGGSGTGTGIGSMGIYVSAGSPSIHGNTIHGGSGHGDGGGSFAIYDEGGALTRAAGAAIRTNVIDGGTGFTSEMSGIATMGIFARQTVDVLQNRVFAGAPGGSGYVYGISDFGTGSLIADNMVLAGPDADTYPITLSGPTPLVAFNTVFGGKRSDGLFSGQISVFGSQSAVIKSNLLLGDGVANSAGIVVDACYGDVLTIENNAFGNNYHGTYAVNGGGSGCYANWTSGSGQAVGAMQTSLMAVGVTTGGNIGLESDCMSGDTNCTHVASCTDVTGPADAGADPTSACMTELISSWSASDQGKTDLFAGGWTLPPTDPCPLLNAALAVAATGDDLYGTPRPAMGAVTMGAYQIPTQPASCP